MSKEQELIDAARAFFQGIDSVRDWVLLEYRDNPEEGKARMADDMLSSCVDDSGAYFCDTLVCLLTRQAIAALDWPTLVSLLTTD
jgi:hypothetical protein